MDESATLGSVWRGIRIAIESTNLILNRVLSWSIWVPVLLVGSVIGVYFKYEDIVMLLLTIQTSVDAAATKTLQSHVREADEERHRLFRESLESTRSVVQQTREQTAMLIEYMRAAERRDRLSAKRDKLILDAIEASGVLYEYMAKEHRENTRAVTPSRSHKPSRRKRA